MRRLRSPKWMLMVAVLAPMAAVAAAARAAAPSDVAAGLPTDVSVTVYRAPDRAGGSIDLDDLEGFALVSETRAVHIPAGESRLRFAGVAEGIETASVIVAGMPAVVLEKNLDARYLSPAALLDAAVGSHVVMLRTHAKSGLIQQLPGIIESAVDGVVFKSEEGVEALRCSGLSETFEFETSGDLNATPTLSVRVRSERAVNAVVTLSYLSRGFDWAADYSATLSADGNTLNLGAWVTLANGNGIGFPSARTQVVAGRVNREQGTTEPIDDGGPIIAKCWPQGTTSDVDAGVYLARKAFAPMPMSLARMAAPAAALEEVVVTGAQKVMQEQLGDLKLYRVPERTTVAGRQSKQVRLLDKSRIPVQRVYHLRLDGQGLGEWRPAQLLLRTKNDTAHGLGLPLPSGRISVFAVDGARTVLENEAGMRDLAVGEDWEIELGTRSEVQVRATTETRSIDAAAARLPTPPGLRVARSARGDSVRRVDIANALPWPVSVEMTLDLGDGAQVIRSDHPLRRKNGHPLLELTVPANGRATVRYETRESAG